MIPLLGAGLAFAALVIERLDLVADGGFNARTGTQRRMHDALVYPRRADISTTGTRAGSLSGPTGVRGSGSGPSISQC